MASRTGWPLLLLFVGLLACEGSVTGAAPTTPPAAAAQPSQTEPVRTPEGTGGVNAPETIDKPYVVLVSFDGFRHDYRSRYDTPNFDRVADTGAWAEALIPVYPSLTFPSHYSIATGLYPEHHGIVGNRFFDPVRGEAYHYRNTATVQDGTWYGGEPIWVTAETQGMVAAAMLFVGTEAAVGGVRPTYWTPYDARGSHRERVAQVVAWLSLPAHTRPHLITLYFSAVDGAGHDVGPVSPAVGDAVRQVDHALGQLLDGLEMLPYRDQVSVVLVSDHGMGRVDPDLVTDLREIADLRNTRVVVTGPGVNLFVGGDADRARTIRDDINDGLRGGPSLSAKRGPERAALPSGPADRRRGRGGRAGCDDRDGQLVTTAARHARVEPASPRHARHLPDYGSRDRTRTAGRTGRERARLSLSGTAPPSDTTPGRRWRPLGAVTAADSVSLLRHGFSLRNAGARGQAEARPLRTEQKSAKPSHLRQSYGGRSGTRAPIPSHG